VSDDPSTGQHHIMHNVPFGDQRSYDNVGFQEDVPLPPGDFDASRYSLGHCVSIDRGQLRLLIQKRSINIQGNQANRHLFILPFLKGWLPES
jgi:hypothetical protein